MIFLFYHLHFHVNIFSIDIQFERISFDLDGGMENPCMNFLTPTLLAGDRSLISTIVHEMTHSWTGEFAREIFNSSYEDVSVCVS